MHIIFTAKYKVVKIEILAEAILIKKYYCLPLVVTDHRYFWSYITQSFIYNCTVNKSGCINTS